jgi:uncharacterized membrane protein (UPF0127 family)
LLTGGTKKTGSLHCVFNRTRESFLSLSVTLADTHFARLKGLVGKLRLKGDEGIWVVPSQGVHTIGVLFSIDLLYLDGEDRVIGIEESFGTFRIGPVRTNCASVLELPPRTIYCSQTQVGDQLLICRPDVMETFLRDNPSTARRELATEQEKAFAEEAGGSTT